MTSLRQLPTRRIVSMLTRAIKRAMAPPVRIDRALTSSGVNPTWGPMRLVAARCAVVILVLRTVDQAAPLKTEARCVSGVAPCCRRCATRRHCTCSGVSSCAMSDGFPFDAIFLHRKEEANKGGCGAGGG